jgi:hypothetical protein
MINFNSIRKQLHLDDIKKTKTLNVGWQGSMAKIAKLHEYGGVSPTPKRWITYMLQHYGRTIPDTLQIPARPHRYQTEHTYKEQWAKQLQFLLGANNWNIEKSLLQLGAIMRQDYMNIFNEANFTPLWEVTLIMRKVDNIRGTRPLYATGALQRELHYWLE